MIINVIRLFVECTKVLLVLFGILNLKRKKRPVNAYVLITVFVVMAAVKGIQDPKYWLSTFLWCPAMACAFFAEDRRRILYAFLAILGICFVDDMVLFLTKWVVGVPEHRLSGNSLLFCGINAISVVLIGGVVLLLRCVMKKGDKMRIISQDIATSNLVVLGVGMFTLSFFLAPFNLPGFRWEASSMIIIGLCACVFCSIFLVVGLLLVNSNHTKKSYMRIAKMNEKYLQMVEEHYQTLSGKNEEVRKFRHDIKNHMLCVESLLDEKEYGEAKKYISDMRETFREMEVKYQTGNVLVNAIVNDVAGKYAGVVLGWNGFLPGKMQIGNPDLCVIFSNVLDNAFSAASGCMTGGKVDVSVQTVGNSLKILVENTMGKPIEEKQGKFITQKEDKKNHGFGIINVRERVCANGGEVRFSYTETQFTAKIILPNAF